MKEIRIYPVKFLLLFNRTLLFAGVLYVLFSTKTSYSQCVINENVSMTDSVGSGTDYIGQSFIANVSTIDTVGIWLWPYAGPNQVKFGIAPDDGAGNADETAVLWMSGLISLLVSGQWFYIGGLGIPVTSGLVYHVLIDTTGGGDYGLGYSTTGFTSTGENLKYSLDGGVSWTLWSSPMTIYVSGDCTPPSSISVTNDTSICTGDSVTLTVTITDSAGFPAPYTFLWSPADSLSCTTCQSPVAKPTSTTIYMVMVTDSTGANDSAFVTITVFTAPPVANAGLDTTICQNDSVQLNATGGAYYSWSPATGLSDTGIANPYAGPTVTTTYYVIVSNDCGSNVDSVIVTVNPLPIVTVTADTSICPSDSIQLNAGGGVSYLWNPGTGLSDSTIANPVAVPSTTTTYYVTGIAANGCTDTDSIKITVNSIPQLIASTAKDTICPNDSTQIVAASCTPLTENFESGAPNWVASGLWHLETQQSFSPTTSFTYNTGSPNYNFDTGVTNSGSLTSPPIDLTGKAPTDSTILTFACYYETEDIGTSWDQRWIQISANGGPFNNFLQFSGETMNVWHQHQIDLSAFNGDNIEIRFYFNSIDGAFNDFWGWSIDDVELPCSGIDTTLTFTWTPSTGLSNPNIANPMASPSSTTTYIVSTTIGSCSGSDTITIYVDTTNFITATPVTATICEGDSIQLGVIGSSGQPDDSSWTYAWSPANTLTDSVAANPLAFPASATTYQIVVSNVCGVYTDTMTVTVNPVPTVDAGVDTSYCYGDPGVGLEALGPGGTSFVWSPAAGLTCTACTKPTASPSSTTTYYVTGTAANGCTNTDSIKVIVNGSPITATSSTDSICPGDTTQLNVVTSMSIFYDDFDPGIDPALWFSTFGSAANNNCGSMSGSNALYFNGIFPPREAVTNVLDVLIGGTISFYLKIGSSAPPCDLADFGENVLLEYSTDGGGSWNIINTYLTGSYIPFTPITEIIPAGAQTASTQFRWSQPFFSIFTTDDNWAIDDVEITAGGGTLDTSATVTWSPSTGLSNPNIANPLASPTVTTTYVVTVGDGSCDTTSTITVYVDNTITVITPSDAGICSGDSIQLYATSNNPMGIVSWSWTPADGLSDTTIANPVANPSSTTTYTVTATNALGCQISKDVTVSVAPYPVASFTHSDSVLTVAFTDASVNAGSWVWNFGDGYSSGLLNPTYTYADTGTYNACLIVTNACTSDTLCENITVTDCQFPIALFGNSISGLTADFTDLSLNATGWSWDFGDGSPNDTNQNPIHTYADTGTYIVCLTATSACGSNNKCNAVSITSATGIAENYLENGVNIYPNPNSGEFMLEIYDLRFLNYDLKIYDVLGREILKSKIKNLKSKINLSGYPAGIYNLQIITDQGTSNKKIIKFAEK